MFRYKGRRTLSHNLRLATLLSLVAGMVNICGVLSIKILTTNVTGHFAFFAEEIILKNYSMALTLVAFVFCFLFGSFLSGLLTEVVSRSKVDFSPVLLPVMLEISVLVSVCLYGGYYGLAGENAHWVASAMLFSMGLQNSLVTQVSKSIVRTTHLTGLFTDLGIELAQLIFYRKPTEIRKLTQSIYLRSAIILFFFIGSIAGGVIYSFVELKVLYVACVLLLITLFYDTIRFHFYSLKRKIFEPH